jgi:hypothetical protein
MPPMSVSFAFFLKLFSKDFYYNQEPEENKREKSTFVFQQIKVFREKLPCLRCFERNFHGRRGNLALLDRKN